MTSPLLYSRNELLAHNGSLLNGIITPSFSSAASGGDEGYKETVCFNLSDAFLWKCLWVFNALNIPDRMTLTFSNGQFVDTGYLGRIIGMPSSAQGEVFVGNGNVCCAITVNIMPGFSGTRWNLRLEYKPYQINI